VDPNEVSHAVSQVSDNAVAIIGVLIPIVAIVMGLGIGMLKLSLDYRKKREILQAHHAERMAAIEKGIELPPLPPQFYGPETSSLATGVIQDRRPGGAACRSPSGCRSCCSISSPTEWTPAPTRPAGRANPRSN
jgi:hypothetical protein